MRIRSSAVVACVAIAVPTWLAGCASRGSSGIATTDPSASTRLIMGGEMTYMADAARFFECGTNRGHSIALEGDFVALERAYRDAAPSPGARLYVTFEGSIVPRPGMEGDGTEPAVVVTRFIRSWPDETCERALADASLTNTYWRIVRLGSEDVVLSQDAREPHLTLREEAGGMRYAATVGCNQVGGECTITGNSIRFGAGVTTLMACPPPLDEMEQKLVGGLAAARRWVVKANTLELYDEAGKPLALFQAVYF